MHKYTKPQKEQRVIVNYLRRLYSWLISPKSYPSWIYHLDDLSALERNTFIRKTVLTIRILFKTDYSLTVL